MAEVQNMLTFAMMLVLMVIVVILLVPWPGAIRKLIVRFIHKFMHSRTVLVVNVMLALFLFVIWVSAVRNEQRYSDELDSKINTITFESKLDLRIKVFREQRNSYIAGFSIFLIPVIYRLYTLLAAASPSDELKALREENKELKEKLRHSKKNE
mmetsp:Transcript_22044/g.61977  ORF Transcript_22044/g.61977 Transcript_22044/m.61977 type:complete len:154 (+) Transcript_22044:112-573(+)|eukprot:CAMPEP_0119122486 /NCGR_PEP_ID=MMETSP1310-20130426/2723_1 /TAXON_ID=464262 /ORGANISM="Genus nov. species nov., Strain RCC2339" /LENGTH=153 /DNA_ID=CAMNT_0007112145 /DNA_START=106 /DNA_END=567 /DNA_ORIENTATION=+